MLKWEDSQHGADGEKTTVTGNLTCDEDGVNQIEAMPDDAADVAVNISSLHEFKPRQIDNTLRQMARLARAAVYLKQYKTYVNPADRLIVQESAYRLPEGWQPQLWRTDTADPRFFEAVFVRSQGQG